MLRIKFSAGRQFSASKSASSPSAKTLSATIENDSAVMKLQFLDSTGVGNKIPGVVTDQLIRLYDFDKRQADKLRQEIKRSIIDKGEELDLSKLEFIEKGNCNLTLRLAKADTGITAGDKTNFNCDLTLSGYVNMVNLLKPFCILDNTGHQWLYDIDTPIDLLFSPSGTW